MPPRASPAATSRRMTRHQSRSRSSPRASARTTSVEAWEPELPPLLMMSGTKSARMTARAISSWKRPIAVAVSISLRKRAESHPPRFRTMVQKPMSKYGASRASMPPNFWMSSVASSWTTSTMSSTVTMPFTCRSSSSTGMARKLCAANSRESASWSISSCAVTTSVCMMSRTVLSGGAENSSRKVMTPRSRCPASRT